MRRAIYFICALLGALAAVGIAVIPTGTTLDSYTGKYYFPWVTGSTQINLLNAGIGTAVCTVVYTNTLGVQVKSIPYFINPNSQLLINASRDVGSSFNGSAVLDWQASTTIIAQLLNRYTSSSGGNNAAGSKLPGTSWGFPFGNTNESKTSEYSTYTIIQNPNAMDANCVANFYGSNGFLGSTSIVVPPGQTKKLSGYEYPGMNKTFGVVVTANNPVVAAVQQYWYQGSSSGSYLAPFQMTQRTTFYDPGILDPNGVATYHLLNSKTSPVNITITYGTTQGGQGTYQTQVPAQSIKTVAQQSLSNYSGNATITSDYPLNIGKTYYWRVDEVNSVGQTNLTGDVWSFTGFTGGQTGSGYDTTYSVGNYNSAPVTGTINYYQGGGQDPNVVSFQVPAKSSKLLKASDTIPAGTFGTVIKTNDPALPVSAVQNLFWGNKKFVSTDSGVGYNNLIALNVAPESIALVANAGSRLLVNAYSFIQVAFFPKTSLSWTSTADVPWLQSLPSGTGEADQAYFTVDATNLFRGAYTGTITVTAPGATNSPQKVTIFLLVL